MEVGVKVSLRVFSRRDDCAVTARLQTVLKTGFIVSLVLRPCSERMTLLSYGIILSFYKAKLISNAKFQLFADVDRRTC